MIVLKFGKEIKGDSTAAGFENHIQLSGVNFNTSRNIVLPKGTGTREAAGLFISEIACSKEFDIASPELFMQSVSGDSLELGTLTYLQTDNQGNPQAYLVVLLKDPIVTNYAHSASPGMRPSESFSLNFTEIKLQYTQYTGEKATKASPKGWNLMASKAA